MRGAVRGRRNAGWLIPAVSLVLVASASAHMAAQSVALASSPFDSTSGTGTVRTVRGRVVDALSGNGIARALVNLNARQVLTDAQGRFEFQQFSDSNATATATRPGFSGSADGSFPAQQRRIVDLDQPVELKLYPDAIVTGIVTGSDGLPLPQVQVILRRSNAAGQGQRWVNVGFATTNSRGEYRMVTPGGRFRVGVNFSMRMRETGLAVSPVTFPDAAANTAGGYFTVASGEERHIDLRPHTGEAYPVLLRVDQAEGRGGVRFSVSTQNGDSFQPGFANAGSPGEYRLELPSGSYTIRAHMDTRDDALEGLARVTVSGHAISGIVVHLAPATSLPVEVHMAVVSSPSASSSASSAPPTLDARQLNLSLRNDSAEAAPEFSNGIPLHQREDKNYDFRVPAGRYRLQGASFSPWYVVSASYGTTDLLSGEIVVGPGAAGQPIRLEVSNLRGRVKGHVTLPSGASAAWVYLIPQQPALSLPAPVTAGVDGTFTAWLPVGSYDVVALESPLQGDLSDPEVLSRLRAGAKPVSVAADTDAPLQLEVERVREAAR